MGGLGLAVVAEAALALARPRLPWSEIALSLDMMFPFAWGVLILKDSYYVLVMLSGAASADIGSSIIVFAKRLGFQVSTFFANI